MRRLEADVFPALGKRPISTFTAPMLLAVAKKIETLGAGDIAKRAWQACGQIFRYAVAVAVAVANGVVDRNPASDVKPADSLKPRVKSN